MRDAATHGVGTGASLRLLFPLLKWVPWYVRIMAILCVVDKSSTVHWDDMWLGNDAWAPGLTCRNYEWWH
jgi:hypothetical protein